MKKENLAIGATVYAKIDYDGKNMEIEERFVRARNDRYVWVGKAGDINCLEKYHLMNGEEVIENDEILPHRKLYESFQEALNEEYKFYYSYNIISRVARYKGIPLGDLAWIADILDVPLPDKLRDKEMKWRKQFGLE